MVEHGLKGVMKGTLDLPVNVAPTSYTLLINLPLLVTEVDHGSGPPALRSGSST